MSEKNKETLFITDPSLLMIEAAVQAGAEVFIGYPITPANLLYSYAGKRFPLMLSAQDEITTLQWMSGFSSMGRFPVTATSFPGFALMLESINMAFMMELPMLIILSQRLGPSTGSATTGADGDLLLLRGAISGGYELPVFSATSPEDSWSLTAEAISCSIRLRTPVVLLTSKELCMTQFSMHSSQLSPITPQPWTQYQAEDSYLPYQAGDGLVPPFLPLGNTRHQVRINSSTHDFSGKTKKGGEEAIFNTRRLHDKIQKGILDHTAYDFLETPGSSTLVIAHGISASAARSALRTMQNEGQGFSLLVAKTLLPVPGDYFELTKRYRRLIFVEENLTGQYRELLFGRTQNENIHSVNEIAAMIPPEKIIAEVKKWTS